MNQQIFLFLNNIAHQYDWLDTLIFFCAQYLPFVIMAVLFIYYFFKILKNKEQTKNHLKDLSIILITTFAIWGISQIINYLYYSPRPFMVLENINVLFTHGAYDSFPSGHTTFFFTLAFISYYFTPKILTAFLLDGAILVALSRIISGVHWPADILGAIILAGVGVFTINKIFIQQNWQK